MPEKNSNLVLLAKHSRWSRYINSLKNLQLFCMVGLSGPYFDCTRLNARVICDAYRMIWVKNIASHNFHLANGFPFIWLMPLRHNITKLKENVECARRHNTAHIIAQAQGNGVTSTRKVLTLFFSYLFETIFSLSSFQNSSAHHPRVQQELCTEFIRPLIRQHLNSRNAAMPSTTPIFLRLSAASFIVAAPATIATHLIVRRAVKNRSLEWRNYVPFMYEENALDKN